MRINQKKNASLVMVGNVSFGNVVIFHSHPCKVPNKHGFHKERVALNEPYILVDYGCSSAAFLIRASNGDPVRASYGDFVEEIDRAELTL